MKKYIEQLVCKESRTELDLDSPYYSATEKDEHGDALCLDVEWSDTLLKSYVETDVSIDIDEVIKILESFKSKGADRVFITDHADHHGYYFYGTRIEEVDVLEPAVGQKALYSASAEVVDALQMMIDMHMDRYGLDSAFDERFIKANAIFNKTVKV